MKKRSMVQFYQTTNVVDGKTVINHNSYALFYDKASQGVYRASVKKINEGRLRLLTLTIFFIMLYFPSDFIPYDNVSLYILTCLITMFGSMWVGYRSTKRAHYNYRSISLTEEKWEDYLTQGNAKYLYAVGFTVGLLFLLVPCCILSYYYQAKWWLFTGLGFACVAGMGLISLSKTRYLLYKYKITGYLNKGE